MRDPDADIAELTLIGVLQHGTGGEKILGLLLDGGLHPFGGGKAAAPGQLERRTFQCGIHLLPGGQTAGQQQVGRGAALQRLQHPAQGCVLGGVQADGLAVQMEPAVTGAGAAADPAQAQKGEELLQHLELVVALTGTQNIQAAACVQAETTAQLHEKKFLPGFAEDAWETASLDSKTELAKQLAAYELAMLGVPDGTEVTVQPLDEDRLGYYSAASRQIVLSRSVLESGTAQETMDTIAHEAFHVQQAYVVENIDWDDAATQAACYDQARRWLRNYQNGYVSGEEDILSYYFQPVEVDARAYAAEETERLQGLIDKELQKET